MYLHNSCVNKISKKIEEESQKFYFNLESKFRKFRRCYPVYFSQNVCKAIIDQEVFDELGESVLPLFDRSNLIPL